MAVQGLVGVYKSDQSKFVKAYPHVYISGQWVHARPYVWTNGAWQMAGGAATLMDALLDVNGNIIYDVNGKQVLVREDMDINNFDSAMI